MIILTEQQAATITGPSTISPCASLYPVLLKDGTYMLGEQVLSDQSHADVRSILEVLPTREVDPSEVAGADLDD